MTQTPHPRQISVDQLSLSSLVAEVRANGNRLSSATGFAVIHGDQPYLITNWHVVSGRDADSGELLSKTGAVPDELLVAFHWANGEGETLRTGWRPSPIRLLSEEGDPLWLDHPNGRRVDVAALPLRDLPDGVSLHPVDLALSDADIFAGPGSGVSIIGFPFGLTGGALFPIWKRGHIASEPDVDFDDRPMFLIDATTREGMSGAPVFLRFAGHGYKSRAGFEVIAPGVVSLGNSEITRFLGVYAGRIHSSAEVGRVWRPEVISEILRQIT